ncbi:protein phosphatase 1 regulatory subunit 7-like [Watersipora subatra]|uniref:protein phosphatase 1 regulatory subunit 7-like n=1 Tax=Watersipora subatra TaxID=2589382 RepID=UPI00355C7E47
MCQLSSLHYDFQWQLQASGFASTDTRLRVPRDNELLTKQPFKIVKLDASLNELTEIDRSSLSPFTNLQALNFSLNRLRRICRLEVFRSLTDIDLSHNKLQRIDFLSSDSNVVNLKLSANDIEQLNGLSSLHVLSILHLSENKLRSLEGIQALPSLRELHIQRNEILSLVPLTANRNLVCLNAAYNRIDSLRTTAHSIENLHQLKSIILLGNPIEDSPDYHLVLREKESLTSLDNITLKRSSPHEAMTREREGLDSLRDVAQQAFWNQLALRREERDEKIGFLHERIMHIQDEYNDHEQRLRSDLEATLLHLNDLTANPRRAAYPPMQKSRLHKPEGTDPSQQLSLRERKAQTNKKYRGITDTGEILRLAATELSYKQGAEGAEGPS